MAAQGFCHLGTLPTGFPSILKMHGLRTSYPEQLKLSFKDRLLQNSPLLWNRVLNTLKERFHPTQTIRRERDYLPFFFFLVELALAWVLASLINRGSWMHPQPPDVMVWGTLQLWEVSVNLSNW